jgi:acyl-CoA dehydrogenase
MNEQQTLLSEMTERLFTQLAASPPEEGETTAQFQNRWQQFEEMDLQALLVPEAQGGFGGGAFEAWLVFHLAGRHAIDLPVIEAILAADILAAAGIDLPTGVLTIAPRIEGRLQGQSRDLRFTGSVTRAPWGRHADHIAGIISHEGQRMVICLPTAGADHVEHKLNAADEPRDDFEFTDSALIAAPANDRTPTMLSCGALARSAQIAGACRAALDLTRGYVNDRSQFGRPIAKFQAIQHAVATLAEQASASEAASRAAFEAISAGAGLLEIASAKIVSNIAAENAIAIAHQTHGAMGFTWEYALHPLTRRLIAWCSEFGNTRYWSGALGEQAAAAGPVNFWPMIVNNSR